MRSLGCLIAIFGIVFAGIFAFAQTQPNLDNGFKPYGSYGGGDLDSVNLQNGNLILHIPMPFNYPQRGNRLSPKNVLRLTSKSWAVVTIPNEIGGVQEFWSLGFGPGANLAQVGTGIGLDHTLDVSLHRILQWETGGGGFSSSGYYITTWDGGLHQLHSPGNAPTDANGTPTSYDAIDGSGYHVDLSNPNSQTGIPNSGVIIDRAGNRYQIAGWTTFCSKPVKSGFAQLPSLPGESAASQQLESEMDATYAAVTGSSDPYGTFKRSVLQDASFTGSIGSTSITTCQQASRTATITDVNGNVLNSFWSSTPGDTMGRPLEGVSGATQTTDYTGCINASTSIPISSAAIYTYLGVGGAGDQVKLCFGTFPIQTSFGVAAITEYQNETSAQNNGVLSGLLIVTVILSDAPNWGGTRWTFNYDGYLNPTDIGLPSGGSIHYDWTQIAQPNCGTVTPVSRAIAARTVNDSNGNSSKWTYQWGASSGGSITNKVTDPLNNDSVHVFTSVDGANGCLFYETSTRQYQGSSTAGTLLKQVDTTYSSPTAFDDPLGANGGLGNIVPVSIRTTLTPNNNVSLTTRTYDNSNPNPQQCSGDPPALLNLAVTYTYDSGANGIGHLTSLTDQAGSGSYSYDALGRIASESRTIAGVQKNLAYTYNLDSSVATLSYPSGAVVTYTPDAAGRILSAVDSGNSINYVKNATYDATSALTGFLIGQSSGFAGISNSFSYNKRLQPVSMAAVSPNATVFSIGYDFHLGNGDNGNVFGITNYRDTTRNQTFTYDALNRLTSAQNAGTDCTQHTVNGLTEYWGNSYSYDPWGNLLQKNVTKCLAENLSVTALANNQLSGYGYDAAGNMTHDATTGNNYAYDQENRITGAAGYTYTYDADGNRVEKSNGATGTIYWYMTPGVVAESDLSGNLKSEYVFFDGERVARKDFPGNSVFYYFSDHLKTASVITDSAGTIKEDEDYYPWGGELQFVNNDSNHFKLTGKERDSETQLDYFGARYYGNWLGRWMSPDWAAKPTAVPYADLSDPQSLNLYGYVRNIPTTRLDADGHCCWTEFKNWWKYDHWTADENEAKRLAKADKEYADKFWKENGPAVFLATSVTVAYYGTTTEITVAASTNPSVTATEVTVSETEATAESAELQPYGGPGGGHHVPAKSAFTGSPAYDPNKALAIPNAELQRLGLSHTNITTAQMELYRGFARTGSSLTWQAVENIETQALVQAGMNQNMARQTVQTAISELQKAGVADPTRIPWGGK